MPKYYDYKVAGYYLYFTSHCIVEAMHVHASDRKMPWNYRKLFDSAMGGAAMLSCDELERRTMALSGIRQKQYYYKVLEEGERQRVVKKVLDKGGRVAVMMLPC